jgi:hypothetical protein
MWSAVAGQKERFLGTAMVLLDLEGLVSIAEKLTDRLIIQEKEKGNV